MKQYVITPAAGKRLIAKALATHPTVQNALKQGTIVILAGTTNGYVTEEIFKTHGITGDFSRKHFFRGIILPPAKTVTAEGRLTDESKFPGDVIITRGMWQKGKTIANVVDDLKEGDVILKGANALDLQKKQAAILIGHTKAGTIAVALQAVLGRRVSLIIPVGLEKRLCGDLHTIAAKINMPSAKGYRLFPVPGQVFTELDAITLLTSATAELIAAGGVCGAEGSCLLAVSGTEKQEEAAEKLLSSVASEPRFEF
ncbi:MAG: hypothetical protein NWE94_01665 [Candidatus Bathyarchaeota archaeon]|nr:hypothetical protein [Candidatus Bathyarchaeota archaeon]